MDDDIIVMAEAINLDTFVLPVLTSDLIRQSMPDEWAAFEAEKDEFMRYMSEWIADHAGIVRKYPDIARRWNL